ncbi:MAG: iron-transfer P-loop NTPase [Actinomycetota bacterium]|nr:iron-transfer P-loop NTPase [Actinomycetota bacterium]
MSLNVALVCPDPQIRQKAARAFDRAPQDWDIDFYSAPPLDADVVVLGPGVEGAGIRFDPEHPDRLLEDVRKTTRPSASLVAVTSASRGLGVTSVALHLAAAAATGAERTLLVDLDRTWRGVAARLGFPHTSKTWAHATDPDAFSLVASPVAGGFHALLAPSVETEAPAARDVLRLATQRSRCVIIDLPADGPVEEVVPLCSSAILLVAPSWEGAERARSVASTFPSPPVFVANRLGAGSDIPLRDLEAKLGAPFACELPYTPSLRDSEDDGRLMVRPSSRWCRRVAGIYSRLLA